MKFHSPFICLTLLTRKQFVFLITIFFIFFLKNACSFQEGNFPSDHLSFPFVFDDFFRSTRFAFLFFPLPFKYVLRLLHLIPDTWKQKKKMKRGRRKLQNGRKENSSKKKNES